jgi:type I restriction enzyme M protein
MGAIRVKSERLLPGYLFKQLTTGQFNEFLRDQIAGANINNLSGCLLYRFAIPLPPLKVQKEIVSEIEGYQKVIDGARAVLDNYRPHIPIRPEWLMVALETINTIVRGSSPRPQGDPQYFGGPVPRLMVADITRDGMYATPQIDSLTELGATKSRPMIRAT